MGAQNRGTVLWMELHTHIPAQGWYLHNLNQMGGGVLACALHALTLKLFFELAVEFIAVAMTLLHLLFASLGCGYLATIGQLTGVGA